MHPEVNDLLCRENDYDSVIFKTPPDPTWECCFSGNWSFRYCTTFSPNWVGRLFQKWFLDIHWRKIEE